MDREHYFQARPELQNSAPVEALIKVVAYWLRTHHPRGIDADPPRFLEVGCGLGHNLEWLADRGVEPSGLDISPTAVAITRLRLEPYTVAHTGRVVEGTADRLPFAASEFDGVIEACALQHLGRYDRAAAYQEAARVLRPGGLFVGYSVSTSHTVFRVRQAEQLPDDPGTIMLDDPRSSGLLSGIGLTHFFSGEAEFCDLLPGFEIECLPVMFRLPSDEARRRGFEPPCLECKYEDHFLIVRGVKR